MGTPIAEVISDYAMVEINDIRLDRVLTDNPALFYRRMWLYFSHGLPQFSRPPEIRQYLETGLIAPEFADFEWVSTDESVLDSETVETGLIGYELFSCALVETDGAGNTIYTAYPDAEYDPETGEVEFPAQSAVGLEYTMDFYTDGSFAQTLTRTQKRILGLCTHAAWESRFTNDFLKRQPKNKSKSFDTISEAATTAADTVRIKVVRANLETEIEKYERDCEYATEVPNQQVTFV